MEVPGSAGSVGFSPNSLLPLWLLCSSLTALILPHHRQKGESNSKNLTSINMLLIESFNGSIYLSLSLMSNWTPNNIIVDKAAEEKAIAEKGFFLHPSPASTPPDLEPRLLPLFPVTSSRVSGSDS
ncbi:hypothetical protein Ancab_010344 [Ancistrocladus abbreviatus]